MLNNSILFRDKHMSMDKSQLKYLLKTSFP
uniref:Uncharacterized protein n=1 Tax=Setaria italica TaxID=4555 RepID=K3Z1A2_SETIT